MTTTSVYLYYLYIIMFEKKIKVKSKHKIDIFFFIDFKKITLTTKAISYKSGYYTNWILIEY